MVSLSESIILGLAIVGLGIPAWIFSIAVYHAARRPRIVEPGSRYFAYMRVMEFLYKELGTGKTECAPLWVATVRELRQFPEYADLSILYLEEVTVTGKQKFDRVMDEEIKETEAFLLESRND